MANGYIYRWVAAGAFATMLAGSVLAADEPAEPGRTVVPSGIRLNPNLYRPPVPTEDESLRLQTTPQPSSQNPIPTFNGDKPVVALASAIGGQLAVVMAKESVGSNMDSHIRHAVPFPDRTLDSIVLRGMDRTIAKAMPDSERVFMRLNPALLDDVPPADREKVAMQKLLAEIRNWPQRQRWDRIVVVTPHYRGFERNGLGSRLHGIGIYTQDLYNQTDFEVIEPDGTPGQQRRSRFVALYIYATMIVLDAKSLAVIDVQPWLIDEKIHDSRAATVRVEGMIDPQVFAARLEKFAETASSTALARTLGGRVEPGELRQVPLERK